MPVVQLAAVQTRLEAGESAEQDSIEPSQMRICLPLRMRRRGGRTIILNGAALKAKPDTVLVKALRAAHEMIDYDPSGLPILDQAPASPYQRRLLRLAFLAPDIQRAILDGRQPEGLSLARLLAQPIPSSWAEQSRHVVGTTLQRT